MNKKKSYNKAFIIYEIILLIVYLATTIFFYFYFDKSRTITMDFIAIGALANIILFVVSFMPQTRKIPKEERDELDLNTAGVRMAQAIFTFNIIVLDTMLTIFFGALVLASAIGRI